MLFTEPQTAADIISHFLPAVSISRVMLYASSGPLALIVIAFEYVILGQLNNI